MIKPIEQKIVASDMSWDEFFMRMVYLTSSKSKDPRTRIGAILIKKGDVDPLSFGYNGFPRGVDDFQHRYTNRELKHKMICHAEFNCLVNAARNGVSTLGTILYTQAPVCHECAKSVIQFGVTEIVYHKQFPDMTKEWLESSMLAKEMLNEAGVFIRCLDLVLGIKTLLSGKVVEV